MGSTNVVLPHSVSPTLQSGIKVVALLRSSDPLPKGWALKGVLYPFGACVCTIWVIIWTLLALLPACFLADL